MNQCLGQATLPRRARQGPGKIFVPNAKVLESSVIGYALIVAALAASWKQSAGHS